LLAVDLGVSRGVVVRVYEQLTAEGYLNARHGAGTQVADTLAPVAPAPHRTYRPPTNPGLPEGGLFPRRVWLRAASRALAELTNEDLGYGDPAGLARLRSALSSYLGRARAVIAPADLIVVVNGFAQATRLLGEVLLGRGIAEIAVEDPGSVGLRDQLTRVGMVCRPVPVDEEGLRVDVLETIAVRAVVVTPAHQFPTGVVMSPDRRHRLLEWARAKGGLVIEDDYDAEYRYDRSPVGAIQGLEPDVVAYKKSVSKTLAPGLRIGWLVLPDLLVGALAQAKYATDLATGVWEQATLSEFITSGEMDRHIRRTGTRYQARRDRLVAELTARLPGWTIAGAGAGLHVLVYPSAGREERELVSLAQRSGLDARPLGDYAVAETDRPGLVIGYGHQHPSTLAGAVERLAAILQAG
jgi:GntR family transcriptional regulator/MocR family aminotransferase